MLRSTLATLLIGFVLFLVQTFLKPDGIIHPDIWYILGFYLALSLLIDRLIGRGLKNDREKFVTSYLSISVVRFILSLVFLGIFLFLKAPEPRLFVANFFALYLFYTSFEIWGIYRKLRAN